MRGLSFNLGSAWSPRLLPWLVIFGLCLFKPNRSGSAWLVWLPLFIVWGLALVLELGLRFLDSEVREMIQFMVMALGFGWSGTLLLAPWLPWPSKLGRFGSLLLVLGMFTLLGLAFGHEWSGGMFADLLAIIAAVLLQFAVFALVAAVHLASWSTRPPYHRPGFLGWFILWLLVVWLALVIPCASLTLLGNGEALAGILILASGCALASFVTTLPFLLLGAIQPVYKQRLVHLVSAPPPSTGPQPVPPSPGGPAT